MSKLAEQLRQIKVYNNFGLLERFGSGDDVAIEYHRPADGRLGWSETTKTRIWTPLPNKKLKPPRRFSVTNTVEKGFYGQRKVSFPEAIAWAKATFKHEYVPSPFGGHIPKHVLAKAKAAVKERMIPNA